MTDKIGEWITPNIHILYGTGHNCTCYDCVVLYGGECATSKDNDFLDDLETKVLNYLTFTPKGKDRKKSDSYMDKCIELVVKPEVCKYAKIKKSRFDNFYYGFMPILYLMTSANKEATRYYRMSRGMLFNQMVEELKKL